MFKGNSLYTIRVNFGMKLVTNKIRVTFSDLRDHRNKHNVKRMYKSYLLVWFRR